MKFLRLKCQSAALNERPDNHRRRTRRTFSPIFSVPRMCTRSVTNVHASRDHLAGASKSQPYVGPVTTSELSSHYPLEGDCRQQLFCMLLRKSWFFGLETIGQIRYTRRRREKCNANWELFPNIINTRAEEVLWPLPLTLTVSVPHFHTRVSSSPLNHISCGWPTIALYTFFHVRPRHKKFNFRILFNLQHVFGSRIAPLRRLTKLRYNFLCATLLILFLYTLRWYSPATSTAKNTFDNVCELIVTWVMFSLVVVCVVVLLWTDERVILVYTSLFCWPDHSHSLSATTIQRT